MSYYFVANIKINDQQEYQKYLDGVDEIFEKFNGEYLAVDEKPEILEGNWSYSKAVLIRFNSKQEFEKWYYSADYQEILKFRLSAAICDSILIEGVD
jgi:uncharacterized protein (DUF1330 family)